MNEETVTINMLAKVPELQNIIDNFEKDSADKDTLELAFSCAYVVYMLKTAPNVSDDTKEKLIKMAETGPEAFVEKNDVPVN